MIFVWRTNSTPSPEPIPEAASLNLAADWQSTSGSEETFRTHASSLTLSSCCCTSAGGALPERVLLPISVLMTCPLACMMSRLSQRSGSQPSAEAFKPAALQMQPGALPTGIRQMTSQDVQSSIRLMWALGHLHSFSWDHSARIPLHQPPGT